MSLLRNRTGSGRIVLITVEWSQKESSGVQGITVQAEAMNTVVSLAQKWTMEMKVST